MEINTFVSKGNEINAIFYDGNNIDEVVEFTDREAVKNFNRKLSEHEQLILNNKIIDYQCYIFLEGIKYIAMKPKTFYRKYDLKEDADND